MKLKWQNTETSPAKSVSKTPGVKKLTAEKIQVGHNFAEMYIRFDEEVVMMPPASIKKLTEELSRLVKDYEKQHGKIKPPRRKRGKQQSTAQKVVKALYKSRKVSSKLVSINTKRRKHLPLKDD